MVIKNQRTGQVIQRLTSARAIASPDFQRWLRFHNVNGGNTYLSVNALLPEATNRTRAQVQTIRHVYLDIDQMARRRCQDLERSQNPPTELCAQHLAGEVPDPLKVEEFTLKQAECLQRAMAAEFGSDQAVVDSARLRIPNFFNQNTTHRTRSLR